MPMAWSSSSLRALLLCLFCASWLGRTVRSESACRSSDEILSDGEGVARSEKGASLLQTRRSFSHEKTDLTTNESTLDFRLEELRTFFNEVMPEPLSVWNAKQMQFYGTAGPTAGTMAWDRQWSQNCTTTSVAAGPIPRHFLFVLFEERGAWINQTYPFMLISSDTPAYAQLRQEEQLLIENVRNTLVMNDAKSVHFLDGSACERATSQISDELLRIYKAEEDLRFRSDICRAAALFLEGGYYFDDDMLSYESVMPLIQDTTEFASVRAVEQGLFFNSFVAATPCHPILRRQLELLVEARQPTPSPKYKQQLLGPVTLHLAFNEVQAPRTQLFLEEEFDPASVNITYERALYNGAFEYYCQYVVYDRLTKKIPFCSRF